MDESGVAAQGQRGEAVTPPAPSTGPAVETHGLVKHYRGRAGVVEAVRGVDLRVEAGEVFGFLGPNGAGKSTTVHMLTTLLSITSGSATVAGVDVAREPDEARRRIGVALQEAGLESRQTGRELLVVLTGSLALWIRMICRAKQVMPGVVIRHGNHQAQWLREDSRLVDESVSRAHSNVLDRHNHPGEIQGSSFIGVQDFDNDRQWHPAALQFRGSCRVSLGCRHHRPNRHTI